MQPTPGTDEHDIYKLLQPAMSRAGRRVDLDRCAELAAAIQERGHRDREVKKLARSLGLNPRYLPRQRTS